MSQTELVDIYFWGAGITLLIQWHRGEDMIFPALFWPFTVLGYIVERMKQ